MIPPGHMNVLRQLVARLDQGVNWAITGSLNFALQGLPIKPNDIDLQTDEAGAYEIEHRFVEYVSRKIAFSGTERIRSHFGALAIDGIEVEIMGAIETRLFDGSWGGSSDWADNKRIVEIEGLRVPVLSIAYEHRAYLRLGRVERAAVLAQWLAEHSDDY